MPFLTSLPTELRHRIIPLLFPSQHTLTTPIHLPPAILTLLHINQRLRSDTAYLLSSWSPVWYIPSPTALSPLTSPSITIANHTSGPKLEKLCLDIFHFAQVDRIKCTCYCFGEENWTHPEIMSAWSDATPLLPANIKEVYLDITPAPAETRTQHRIVLHRFLNDKRVQRFLPYHINDVAALISRINTHYGGRVPIRLTGKFSRKSEVSVDVIKLKSGLPVPLDFVGTWIDVKDGRFVNISTAVNRLSTAQQVTQAEKRGTPHPLAALRDVTWSKDTVWQYAIVADAGLEERAMADLRVLAEFTGDKGRMEMEMAAVGNVSRKLQHRVARDMGLMTKSEGEGEERRVVVRKAE